MSPTAERWARWLALPAVLGLALGALSACGDDEPGPRPEPTAPTPTATLDSTQLDFRAAVTVEAGEVVVSWSVTNRSGAPVLVTNRVPDDDGRLSERPDRTYVLPGDEPGRVELAKRVLPVASDAVGDSLPWIGTTPLADGARFDEVVRVPLPLRAYAPPAPGEDPPLPDPVTSVVFCVGVLSGRDDSWGIAQDRGVTTVDHGRATAGQTTRCSEPVDLP